MAADAVVNALHALSDGADSLTIALAGAAAGARVLPVTHNGKTFVPVSLAIGPGRSPWTVATRDADKLRQMFAEHPDAYPAFVEQMEFGLRAFAWIGGRVSSIPTSYMKG